MLLKLVAAEQKWLEELGFLTNSKVTYNEYIDYLNNTNPIVSERLIEELKVSEYDDIVVQEPLVSRKIKIILSNGFPVSVKFDYLRFALRISNYQKSLALNCIGEPFILNEKILPRLSYILDVELFPLGNEALLQPENRETLKYILDIIYDNYLGTNNVIQFVHSELVLVLKMVSQLLTSNMLSELKIISEIIFVNNSNIIKKKYILDYLREKTFNYRKPLTEPEFVKLFMYIDNLNLLKTSDKSDTNESTNHLLGNKKFKTIHEFLARNIEKTDDRNTLWNNIMRYFKSDNQFSQLTKLLENGILMKTPLKQLNLFATQEIFDNLISIGYLEGKNLPTSKIIDQGERPLIMAGYSVEECNIIKKALEYNFGKKSRLSATDFNVDVNILIDYLKRKNIIDNRHIIQDSYIAVSEIAVPYLTIAQNKVLLNLLVSSKGNVKISDVQSYIRYIRQPDVNNKSSVKDDLD